MTVHQPTVSGVAPAPIDINVPWYVGEAVEAAASRVCQALAESIGDAASDGGVACAESVEASLITHVEAELDACHKELAARAIWLRTATGTRTSGMNASTGSELTGMVSQCAAQGVRESLRVTCGNTGRSEL